MKKNTLLSIFAILLLTATAKAELPLPEFKFISYQTDFFNLVGFGDVKIKTELQFMTPLIAKVDTFLARTSANVYGDRDASTKCFIASQFKLGTMKINFVDRNDQVVASTNLGASFIFNHQIENMSEDRCKNEVNYLNSEGYSFLMRTTKEISLENPNQTNLYTIDSAKGKILFKFSKGSGIRVPVKSFFYFDLNSQVIVSTGSPIESEELFVMTENSRYDYKFPVLKLQQ